jgi:hypothetical protein
LFCFPLNRSRSIILRPPSWPYAVWSTIFFGPCIIRLTIACSPSRYVTPSQPPITSQFTSIIMTTSLFGSVLHSLVITSSNCPGSAVRPCLIAQWSEDHWQCGVCVHEYDTKCIHQDKWQGVFVALISVTTLQYVTYRRSMINSKVNYCDLYMRLVILLEVQK